MTNQQIVVSCISFVFGSLLVQTFTGRNSLINGINAMILAGVIVAVYFGAYK